MTRDDVIPATPIEEAWGANLAYSRGSTWPPRASSSPKPTGEAAEMHTAHQNHNNHMRISDTRMPETQYTPGEMLPAGAHTRETPA